MRLAHDGHGVVENTARLNKIECVVCGFARFTAIAVLIGSTAFRALALDVAVGQKALHRLAIKLLDDFFANVAGFFEALKDVIGERFILGRIGRVVIRKLDVEAVKVFFVGNSGFGNELFRRDASFGSVDLDWRAVRVIGAHVKRLMAAHAHRPRKNICLNGLHHVPQMNRTIGVGQSACNQKTTFRHVISLHHRIAPGFGSKAFQRSTHVYSEHTLP